jgi:hypothetical protein
MEIETQGFISDVLIPSVGHHLRFVPAAPAAQAQAPLLLSLAGAARPPELHSVRTRNKRDFKLKTHARSGPGLAATAAAARAAAAPCVRHPGREGGRGPGRGRPGVTP